jgi:hypothetical protein
LNRGDMTKQLKLVEVYRASGEAEALIIKSLLESNGIHCLLKSHAAPSVHVFTVDGMGEYKVMVSESKAEAARRLIGDGNRG